MADHILLEGFEIEELETRLELAEPTCLEYTTDWKGSPTSTCKVWYIPA